jgi:hypothetical protein
MEQGDARRPALGDVRAEAAPLAQQLLAAVAKRAPDHPRLRDEGDLDSAGLGGPEDQRFEPLHRPTIDHRVKPNPS